MQSPGRWSGMRIPIFIFLLVCLFVYQDCTSPVPGGASNSSRSTETGNPMTYLSIERYLSPGLTEFKICLNKIVLTKTSGESEINLSKEYLVPLGGLDLVALGVSPGEYQGVRLNLDSSCGANSIRVSNAQGTFASQEAMVLRFDGAFTVGGSSNKVKLGIEPITNNLQNVSADNGLPIEATRSSGISNSTTRVMRAFVTSTAFRANFGGLAGADAICQALANNANRIGTWKAWLSDSATDAITRLNDVGPWYYVDNAILVAPNLASLASGSIVNGIAKNEFYTGTGYLGVWTGTDVYGLRVPSENCMDWTSNSSAQTGQAGQQFLSTGNWTQWQISPCDSLHQIYCFEQ